MRSSFLPVWRLWLFWLLFFSVFRGWFVAWFPEEWPPQNPWSPWWALYHALPLDLSMAGYLVAIPVLLWFLGLAFGKTGQKYATWAITGFNLVLCGLLVVVFAGNIFLYKEWNTLLNNRALAYMMTSPEALFASLSIPLLTLYAVLYVGLVWGVWKLYQWLVGTDLYPGEPSRWGLAALPLHVVVLIWCIRGGAGVMGINESAVYYSPHLFDNHAATNTLWHLIHSMLETRSAKHNYHFMPNEKAKSLTDRLFQTDTSYLAAQGGLSQGATAAPNVVFIIMESMTAQVVAELGGQPGVCPTLSRLSQEGVLFEQCYSSGFRTDQGLVSVLGGYPAQPDQSIVLQSEKAEKLSSVPKILRQQGYATLFCYGGELTFANIGVWLRGQGFEHLLSDRDFPKAERTQRWGVDDRLMLQRLCRELGDLRQPFFATALTLSLHPPFDVPYESSWNGPTEAQKFLHSAAFADDALRDFFESASKCNWYDNTLFVIVADHGAHLPQEIDLNEPGSRHIPLLFLGKPLPENWRGLRVPQLCNHHDIAATTLALLGQDARPQLPWSRPLLPPPSATAAPQVPNPYPFAYYTNENGLGWIAPSGSGFWSFTDQRWFLGKPALDSLGQQQAQAFLQVFYQDFLEK